MRKTANTGSASSLPKQRQKAPRPPLARGGAPPPIPARLSRDVLAKKDIKYISNLPDQGSPSALDSSLASEAGASAPASSAAPSAPDTPRITIHVDGPTESQTDDLEEPLGFLETAAPLPEEQARSRPESPPAHVEGASAQLSPSPPPPAAATSAAAVAAAAAASSVEAPSSPSPSFDREEEIPKRECAVTGRCSCGCVWGESQPFPFPHAAIEDEDEIFGFHRMDSWRSTSAPFHAGPVMLTEGQTSGESEAETGNGDSGDEGDVFDEPLSRQETASSEPSGQRGETDPDFAGFPYEG